ncbi:MAG: hypothetical protein QXG00_00770 [Candidatus Woesearchaeota archaeon]
MAIIGFNFLKISIEKKSSLTGKVNITNNVSLTNVEETKLPIANDGQTSLRFIFRFSTIFEPDYGNIEIIGEVFWLIEKNEAGEIVKIWKKDKSLPADITQNVLNTILNKCNIEALFLCRDMNLPSPIPLPKFKTEPPPTDKQSKKEEKSEKKEEKNLSKKNKI